MSKKRLTPWFPASVEPVRVGIYQVQIKGRTKYARWNKGQWHLALPSIDRADMAVARSHACYSPRMGGWRGLAKEPK